MHDQELKLIKALRRQKEELSDLLDVKIIGDDGQEIKAHWCVLLSCRFFESMYNSGLTEKETGVVNLKGLNFAAVKLAVDFLYSGSIDLNTLSSTELDDLLGVADFMQIENLREQCVNHISLVFPNTDNCIRLWVLSYLFNFDHKTRYPIEMFVVDNLRSLFKDKTILEIPKTLVKTILTNKELSCVSRDEVAQFMLEWVRFDLDSRKCYVKELVPNIKPNKLTYNMTKKVRRMCRLAGDCQIYLSKCNKILRARNKKDKKGDFEINNPEVVLLSDGKYVLFYNMDSNFLGKLCRLPSDGGAECLLVSAYDSELYVVTSYSIPDVSLQFLYLHHRDLKTQIWSPRESFNFSCFGSSRLQIIKVLLMKGELFMFGKMQNEETPNKCKIMMVEWTFDKAYPITELFSCYGEEFFQFSALNDYEVTIYRSSPQVYHKTRKYGMSCLYSYHVNNKHLSIIRKTFLHPFECVKLLSYANNIFLLNIHTKGGLFFQLDRKRKYFRTERYPKLRCTDHIQKCCVMARNKIYDFSCRNRWLVRREDDREGLVRVYDLKTLKQIKRKVFEKMSVVRVTDLWSLKRGAILDKFNPQDQAASVCRLPWNMICCQLFCRHNENKNSLEDDDLSDVSEESFNSSEVFINDSEESYMSDDAFQPIYHTDSSDSIDEDMYVM